MFNNFLHTVNI